MLGRVDGAMSSLGRFAAFAVWPGLLTVALGSTLFSLAHPGLLVSKFDNQLSAADRTMALNYWAVCLVAVATIYAVWVLVRRRSGKPVTLAATKRLNALLSFILSGPFIVALTEDAIETHHPWRTWLYIALSVAAWWPTLREVGERIATRPAPATTRRSERSLDLLSVAVVAGLWAAYAYVFSGLSLNAHYTLATRTVDLGLYDNIFFQSSHGNPLGCSFLKGESHLSAHFDPILVLLSPLYRLWPNAEFLLVLQAVWCGAGVVPAFLLGRYQLGSRLAGIVWALVYALHPALHGANLYEFHSLTLLMPPLLLALHFFLSKQMLGYYITFGFLLLIREDVSLLMCFVGFYGLISGDRRMARAGWITIIISLSYFVLVKSMIMSSPELFNDSTPEEGNPTESYGFSYYYRDMIPNKEGGKDLLTTLLTNPAFIFALGTKSAKLQYLLVIFAPLLFLPAWAGKARVMLVYGLAFTLLASRSAVYSPHFQYSSVLLPVAVALGPVGLRTLRDKQVRPSSFSFAMMGCLLLASTLSSWKLGAIVENDAARGGFKRVVRTVSPMQRKRYDAAMELIGGIEPTASVSATISTGAHVSNRAAVHHVRQRIETDYVLVDQRDLRGGVKDAFDDRADRLKLLGSAGSWRLYQASTEAKPPPKDPPSDAPTTD